MNEVLSINEISGSEISADIQNSIQRKLEYFGRIFLQFSVLHFYKKYIYFLKGADLILILQKWWVYLAMSSLIHRLSHRNQHHAKRTVSNWAHITTSVKLKSWVSSKNKFMLVQQFYIYVMLHNCNDLAVHRRI